MVNGLSLRNPKPWEQCPDSFTGVHLWNIEARLIFNESSGMAKNSGKPQEVVCCKTCKGQPPNIHRGRIEREIKESIEKAREQRRIARMFKTPRRR